MRSLLIVSNDHVGRSMAGPGIRAYELASRLAGRFDVTLSVPFETDLGDEPFGIVVTAADDETALTALACGGFDVVFAQRLPVSTMLRLARTATCRVYDLYAPVSIELLASLSVEPGHAPDGELLRHESLVARTVLQTGTSFVCASETQRDYWLGRLEAEGRLTPSLYAADPSLRSLVGVVPFGLPSERPRPGRAIKGVMRGISAEDRVILWNGGIWNWFDPLVVIDAVGELARRRDDIRLVFMGTTHPNPTIAQRARAEEARQRAANEGLLDRVVFFREGWVPYGERGAFLLDADLGVSAHRETLESHLAFRTRILDCLWAELPVVVTRGDALADVVQRLGLGLTVGVGDVSGWCGALERLVDPGPERDAARRALAAERGAFEWGSLVDRLVPLLEAPGHPVEVPGARRRLLEELALRGLASYRYRGVLGLARRLAWHARREAGRKLREVG